MKGFLPPALWLVPLTVLAIAGVAPAHAEEMRLNEAEDSPLFADSMQKVFGSWAARDLAATETRNANAPSALATGGIIVIEGSRWYTLPGGPQVQPPGSAPNPKRGPIPLDTTMQTCLTPTCSQTCDATPTCQRITCITETCSGFSTCNPGLTCGGPGPTCAGIGWTCYPGGAPSCSGYPTCSAGSYTCSGSPTCVPEECRTAVATVSVPQPGDINLSFSSSTHLRYTLQCCTNLDSGQWVNVYSQIGTDGVLTMGHTNGCPTSFYRLLIEKL